MITTIPADLLIMFVVGMVFALGAFANLKKSGTRLANKYFLAGLGFQTVFCMPIAVYCYVAFPDWCWMYWLDSRAAPFWLVVLAFFFYYVFFAAGFLGALALADRRRIWGPRGLGIALLILLLFAAINYRRLFFVGSLAEFEQGRLLFLFQRPLLAAVVAGGMSVALTAMIVILSWFGKELDYHPGAAEREEWSKRKARVSVTRLEGGDLKQSITRSLQEWGGLDYLKQLLREKQLVLLKPNLAGGGRDRPGSQTSPELIAAVIGLIRELRPEIRIVIGESGSIVWWDLRDLLQGSRYERLFAEKGCEFVNLSRGEKQRHDF